MLKEPIISFSFDDAPLTAFTHGGEIIGAHGANATYFVSFGILGADSPSGVIASLEDLWCAVEGGHELGCHTFDHKHSWETRADVFERSVLQNRETLSKSIPGTVFKSFAYPISVPSPSTKLRIGRLFECCRGGGQTFNIGRMDLNLLKAYFLDNRTGVSVDEIKNLIDQNCEAKGWLIFVTHDVQNDPSRYGCTKEFFKEVVAHSASSGSTLLTVEKALEHIKMQTC